VTPGTSRDIAGGRRRSSMEVEGRDGVDLKQNILKRFV
jgi:hypothetical protein